MSEFLSFVFIFFIGSILGWIIELIFRRLYHKTWVNPGFLIGPYLPIYGFGLCLLSSIYIILNEYNLNFIIIFLIMGSLLTLIELLAGLFFMKGNKIKLWDYSDRWLNYKGIICPLFSIIWGIAGTLYYYFLADYILDALSWFSENLSFSFILGIFFGTIVIDTVYSTNILVKIKRFAKENKIEVKYEEFKEHIKDFQKQTKLLYLSGWI